MTDPDHKIKASPWLSFMENTIEKSFLLTLLGIILLFSGAVIVVLIAPSYMDPTWTTPSSFYQVQMYEVADPNVYISSTLKGRQELQFVYHIQKDHTLLAFQESEISRIVTSKDLEKYVTRLNDKQLKLTTRVLLLRKPQAEAVLKEAEATQAALQKDWEKQNPRWQQEELVRPDFAIWELYDPQKQEAFALAPTEGIVENWVDKDFILLEEAAQKYHSDPGVIYLRNPIEYRVILARQGNEQVWQYSPRGEPVGSLAQLKDHELGFRSRQELIHLGEHIFAIEGCWYCHTDQTRTLVQDVVLNGSAAYPSPPSSANEYIYQNITFPGTRRIGPDISRTGVKRPSRDWHKGHFWSPKTASPGSIMPSFQHFFDDDPRGTSKNVTGIPNYRFEAIFQYLMTKGTRITPPTQAWWLGADPINTKEIIEGRLKLE